MPDIEFSKREEKEPLLRSLLLSPFATIIASVLTTFIIAAVFLKVGGPVPISVHQTSTEQIPPLKVTGEGSIKAVPDEAVANFGIIASSSTISSAKNQADRIVKNLTRELKALGVNQEDIKTISYTISPRYSVVEGQSKIVGYSINNDIQVSFRDFDNLNQAFDKAAELGANLVGGLRFRLSDQSRKQAEQEARKKAIADAKEKAKELTRIAGISLGKLVNIEENVHSNKPIPTTLTGIGQEIQSSENQPSTQLSPGLLDVKVKITLSYEVL